MLKSKALEVNISDYHVDVIIDEKYNVIQEVMKKYYGLKDGLNIFLKELSHPYKNWGFIVKEARGYTLNYFHLLKKHENGPEATALYLDMFLEAIHESKEIREEAADNLLLFIQKIIKESNEFITGFIPVLNNVFDRIMELGDDDFFLFVKSFYQPNKTAEVMFTKYPDLEMDYGHLNRFLIRFFETTYTYWMNEDDPLIWFEKQADEIGSPLLVEDIFWSLSHEYIERYQLKLKKIKTENNLSGREILNILLEFKGFNQFVETYRDTPEKLAKAGIKPGQGEHWKLFFLFHIMNTTGLSMIHEETLGEIDRTLTTLINHEKDRNVQKLIEKTFTILKDRIEKSPDTTVASALNCILNMGKGVYQLDDIDLIIFFIDKTIDLGFQAPKIGGVGNDWQIRVNRSHLLNIRTWMQLIEINPKRARRLLSSLIINLSISGVFIKDTDLFPRDISRFLNSDITPVYNLAKQLCRLFPAFFNEIGAEGKLRDISTELDEITHRKDILIHFLRKQSHVESSNRIIGFMNAIFEFWRSGDKSLIISYIPPDIYENIQSEGLYIDGVKKLINHITENGIEINDEFLLKTPEDEFEEKLKSLMNEVPDVSDKDKRRIELIFSLYKLLNQKYNLNFVEMDNYIAQLSVEAFPGLDDLKKTLAIPYRMNKLVSLLDYLEKLKKLILSDQSFEARENIYKKRHFTVDIPSMYGHYHELKFNAMGLTFRLESLVNVLFEELIEDIDLSIITKATFYEIFARLRLFDKALRLDGIASVEIERQMDFLSSSLEIRGLTFTQYLDIFKGYVRAVKNIIHDHFNNIHSQNLKKILTQIPKDQLLPKYLPRHTESEEMDNAAIGDSDGDDKLKHRISEIFFRDLIAQSLGLQQLDTFLTRILNTLFMQATKLEKDKLHRLLLYDPNYAMTLIHKKGSKASGVINLGNKGLNMVKLKSLGLPIPPGFIISTEVFRCLDVIETYPPAQKNFRAQVARHIKALETMTGKRFGDPVNPLLFSVRSGSSISQPGMMETYLNVGINEEITEGLAAKTGNPWFAWDCFRRFLQCHGMAYGLERDDFDGVIKKLKEKYSVGKKRQFTGEQMKHVALSYKEFLLNSGIELIEDPMEQLFMTIKAVFNSWYSSKARTYRKIMGISDDWGTAVTIQTMVYGNMSTESGSGVVFTHNPRWYDETIRLWGDFTFGNQGEDVVAGLVHTLPISLKQQEIEMRDTDVTLETDFPEIYAALEKWINDLIYYHKWSPQEIEFTFEGPGRNDLYLLQTRDMAMRQRTKVATFDLNDGDEIGLLGHGIGVSGGAMSGRIVFTLDEIDEWRKSEPETKLILVRGDTVPDDIREIYAADGLLTARGGVTSHASVVAHRLGKTCVVGCDNMICYESDKYCTLNSIRFESGNHISIDGLKGTVFNGILKLKE